MDKGLSYRLETWHQLCYAFLSDEPADLLRQGACNSHCRLTLPLQSPGNPTNIRINLTLPETRLITSSSPLIVCVCHHSNFCGGLQQRILKQSAQWPFKIIQGR